MKTPIKERLMAHLAGDGTANDSFTDELYREAHGLASYEETDLEVVEAWAFSVLAGTCKPSAHYYVKEQIQPYTGESLGWDVRERTGTHDIVYIPCDTKEQAESELADILAKRGAA